MSNASIRADILAKLLLVQSTVDTLSDSENMVLFLRRAMEETPGVSDVHLSVDGKVIPPSDTIEKRLVEHETATGTTEADNMLYAPLRTARVTYGHLVLSLDDAKAFAPYREFMLNIASDIAMSMENRDHIRQINEANAALEQRVEKRTAALKEREEMFRAITSAAQDAIIMMDRDGKIASWNQAAERIFGHTEQEAMGRELHALIAPERFHEKALRGIARYRETGESPVAGKTIELAAVQKDGTEFPIELSLSTVQLRGKWHAIGIVRNISERKDAESTRIRINHALETISSCNSVLVHADNETELLRDMCRVIVDVGSFRMAWVGFAEHDKTKTVQPVAHYGHESDYLKKADITWADTERGRGPTGTAIRTGEIQTNQDFENNPQMQPWREAALKRGYRSSIALPLENSGDVFGALTIYSGEPDAFNEDEIKLLAELANDVAYGIIALRTREERASYMGRLQTNMEATIRAIGYTVEMRDPYTAGHQTRVAELATAIGREMGFGDERIHGLRLAASIHDIGKIQIPAEILSKPSKLSEIEFTLMKTHPQTGYDILKGIEFPWPIADMVLQHHERLDGTGYPQGLKGNEILCEAKILAVADVVEAMSSHRPYRPGLGIEAALDEIRQGRGLRYDADAVDTCIRLFKKKRFTFES